MLPRSNRVLDTTGRGCDRGDGPGSGVPTGAMGETGAISVTVPNGVGGAPGCGTGRSVTVCCARGGADPGAGRGAIGTPG